MGTSPRVSRLQPGFNSRLCARAIHSALGRGDRGHVSLSILDVLFPARDLFTGRRNPDCESLLDGRGYSIGDQAATDHARANFRRNIDRSLWNHSRRAHRPHHVDLSLSSDDFRATAAAKRAEGRNCDRRAVEYLAKLAGIQRADASTTLKRCLGSLLRTDSLRLGGNFRDGSHRRERETSRRAHNYRNARGHVVHHSCITFCR